MSNKVPQIRFNGYSDAWVQRNLAELATMNARIGWQNLRTSEFLDEGDYILITGTDFKDGEIDYSNIHYVEKERFDQDKKIQVQDGSILITKDGTLGKVSYVKNLPGPATLNAGVFNVRVINSDETDSKYLFHYLKAPFLLKFADEQSTGGTIKHLNQNVLVKFPVPLPGLDEQKRIANLLESMDNLIAANQRKLDLLKEQKKGYLQKMFPKNGAKVPELRFEGFADDWEERKVKDIFKITRGQVLAATETSEEKSDISPFPVYSSQTKNNGLMGYYKDYLFDTAITWTTDGANAGTVSYRSGRFYSTNVNGVLISDKGYTNKAISEILNLEAWKWVSHVGNPKLMNNVMGDISIMIPSSFEEQDRLSDFLNQLDDTIALHQRKLDLLKKQKKGFLQKMFV
ncbi:restriction endonuclease subunit S (plasmid) [Weissella cibaria]